MAKKDIRYCEYCGSRMYQDIEYADKWGTNFFGHVIPHLPYDAITGDRKMVRYWKCSRDNESSFWSFLFPCNHKEFIQHI